ncbi:ABC transporter permease [bacterium]|nr:ABC transporter permease [bacterium]
MSFGYIIKEGFSGLRKATLSSFVAITIICIALSLLSFFLIITSNISRVIEDIRSRVELEAFLDKSLDVESSKKIQQVIVQIDGVDSTHFISKAEAAGILKRIMGEDDIFDLVESNPLPASFKIRLRPEFRNMKSAASVAQQLENIDGIEEVSYQKELLQVLDEKIETYHYISLGLGCIAALAAILLVSNTIKLSIYSNRDLIKTMKLVGATNAFIAGPFLMEGIIQGVLGSALAVGISYGLIRAVQRYVLSSVTVQYEIFLVVLGFGILLGFIGSFIAIRFFLKERISDM